MAIDASELALIQADLVAAVCDKTCQIQRRTLVSDGMGQGSETWNTIATVKAGMYEPNANQLANFDYLIGSLATWQVKLPYGTDVKAQDHLIIEGQTLVVQVDRDPHSVPGLLTVLASEIK